VAVDGVGGKTDELCATLGELRLELCERAELSCADGCVVLRVGEEDDPVVADELVEVDGTLGGLGLEVGSLAAEAEGFGATVRHVSARRCQLSPNNANMRGSGVQHAQLRTFVVWDLDC
jgi:hypothetical protein